MLRIILLNSVSVKVEHAVFEITVNGGCIQILSLRLSLHLHVLEDGMYKAAVGYSRFGFLVFYYGYLWLNLVNKGHMDTQDIWLYWCIGTNNLLCYFYDQRRSRCERICFTGNIWYGTNNLLDYLYVQCRGNHERNCVLLVILSKRLATKGRSDKQMLTVWYLIIVTVTLWFMIMNMKVFGCIVIIYLFNNYE